MSKGKLAKFAEMATFPHVVEVPFPQPETEIALRGRWNKDFFKADRPIVLELGCGKGEYTVALARMFPDKNYIGVDIKGSRMWKGASEVAQEGLTNAGFLRTRIEFIDRFFAPDEVSEIWLTFSDPQMKKPTKRLTSTYFLARYRHFLTDGGMIHVKTDSNFLFTYTRLVVEKNALPTTVCLTDINASTTDNTLSRMLAIRTYYESQWLQRGINIKYIGFQLPAAGCLTEPEQEIPFDEYRSYNREIRHTSTQSR